MFPIHDPNDREPVFLNECPQYPGFYKHPDFHIALNKNLEVINLKTGRLLSKNLDPDGRIRYQFRLDNNLHKNVRLHRLVARIFVGRPNKHIDKDFKQLEVNHIDGNSQNNFPSNLEWCIGIENTNHAFNNNLTSNNFIIYCKNIKTKEVTKHRSMVYCANYVNLKSATLRRYMIEKRNYKHPYRGFVFSFKENELDDIEKNVINNRTLSQETIVVDKKFNVKYIFNKIKEASDFIDARYKTVFYNLSYRNGYHSKDDFYVQILKKYMDENNT